MSTILGGSYINNGIIDDTIDTGSTVVSVDSYDSSAYQIDLSGLSGSSLTVPNGGASVTLPSNFGSYGNINISSSSPYSYSTMGNWSNAVSGKLECEGENADIVINGIVIALEWGTDNQLLIFYGKSFRH